MHMGLSTTFKFTLFFFMGMSLVSCIHSDSENNGKLTIYQNQDVDYLDITNNFAASASTSMWDDLVIGTDKYPLYLALYQNQVFYYEIPGLGEGSGTWSVEKNQIKLEAKRSRFDMIFYIYQFKNNYLIKFSDRDGPQNHELQVF